MFSDKFICASTRYTTYERAVPSPYFRKTFNVASVPESCSVTICGLGFYDLWLNGKKLTKGLLAPYISNPDDIVYYDRYDVTKDLRDGVNVLGIQLGNGMQNCPGGQIWDFDRARFRGATRVAFAIEIANADGTSETIEADTSVKTAASPLLFDDLRCGNIYDARREIADWASPLFDDSEWAAALIAETPRGERRLCTADPILQLHTLKAREIRRCTLREYRPRGDVPKTPNPVACHDTEGWLYDFGINAAGSVRLCVQGRAGQHIDLQFGEYLDAEGQPDVSNISFYPEGYSQRDIYVCSGEGEETFEPQFTYHGYRYCVVFGITEEQATENLLTMLVCSSALDERGGFKCSDPVATKLQAMTKNSTLSNFFYFPTDCPHREKNGWTGDAAASAEQTLLNFRAEASYREWLRNICKAQRQDGMLPGIVPTGGWGYEWGNGPAWDMVLTKLPYLLAKLRGDLAPAKECAENILRYLSWLDGARTERGTVDYGLGDWVPITKEKSTPELTSTLVSMEICRMASVLFEQLGQPLKKRFADTLRAELREAVRLNFIDFGTMTVLGNCQTAQAMALDYGAFEPGESTEAFRRLREIIGRTSDHLDCGFLGLQSIFRVLAEHGEADLAYKLITRKDPPSYGDFVARGMTSLPEDFHKAGEQPNSLNHHFLGGISAFFIMYVGGIRVNPYDRNPHEVLIAPCFIDKLDSAAAHHETPDGKITVNWERDGAAIKLTVAVPDGAVGQIRLPNGYCFADSLRTFRPLESGVFTATNTEAVPDNVIEL